MPASARTPPRRGSGDTPIVGDGVPAPCARRASGRSEVPAFAWIVRFAARAGAGRAHRVGVRTVNRLDCGRSDAVGVAASRAVAAAVPAVSAAPAGAAAGSHGRHFFGI